jgi:hypothetical protein
MKISSSSITNETVFALIMLTVIFVFALLTSK